MLNTYITYFHHCMTSYNQLPEDWFEELTLFSVGLVESARALRTCFHHLSSHCFASQVLGPVLGVSTT